MEDKNMCAYKLYEYCPDCEENTPHTGQGSTFVTCNNCGLSHSKEKSDGEQTYGQETSDSHYDNLGYPN